LKTLQESNPKSQLQVRFQQVGDVVVEEVVDVAVVVVKHFAVIKSLVLFGL